MNQAFRVALVSLALIGIFLAGGVVGGIAMAQYGKGRFERMENERREEQHQRQQEQQRLTQLVVQLRTQQQRDQQQLQQQLEQQRPPPAQQSAQGRALPAPEQFGPQLMQRFVNQINPRPTADQRDKIRPMVNQAAEELRRLRRDTAHSTELILQQLEDQIAATLNPAQRDRFTDAIQRWRDATQKFNAEMQQRQAEQRLQEQQQLQRAQQRRQQQQPKPPLTPSPAPTASPAGPPPAPSSPVATPPAP